MKKKRCIMLVDDNPHDNFFHERDIKKVNSEFVVITKNSGIEAQECIKSFDNTNEGGPDPIFTDINMPEMNGWKFLQEYRKLDKKIQRRVIYYYTHHFR